MAQASLLDSWLTPRRLFWLALIGLLTLGAHAFESANILTPLKNFTDNIGQSLGRFDALTLGNRFYGALTGCRFISSREGWYACDRAPFYKRFVLGEAGSSANDCLSYEPGLCKADPKLPARDWNLQFGRLSGKPCTTLTGQPGTRSWVCTGRKVHVPNPYLYPFAVLGGILFTTLGDIWTDSSTLGAVLFITLTLIAAILIYVVLDFENMYLRTAVVLLLTPAVASIMALALKLLLIILISIFSGVLGGVAWIIITFGGAIKIGLGLLGVLDNAKTADQLTRSTPAAEDGPWGSSSGRRTPSR
jgi:hypothetical protein